MIDFGSETFHWSHREKVDDAYEEFQEFEDDEFEDDEFEEDNDLGLRSKVRILFHKINDHLAESRSLITTRCTSTSSLTISALSILTTICTKSQDGTVEVSNLNSEWTEIDDICQFSECSTQLFDKMWKSDRDGEVIF